MQKIHVDIIHKIDKYFSNTNNFYVRIKNQCYKTMKISVKTL